MQNAPLGGMKKVTVNVELIIIFQLGSERNLENDIEFILPVTFAIPPKRCTFTAH